VLGELIDEPTLDVHHKQRFAHSVCRQGTMRATMSWASCWRPAKWRSHARSTLDPQPGASDISGSERALDPVMTESPAQGVLLTVEDHGIGISSVKDIVWQHRGVVEIASQEGEGTAVSVWLPLDPAVAREGTSA
jgi:hypothetical protein